MRRLVLTISALLALAIAAPATAQAGDTVVSLTFDDGWTDQYTARAMLSSRGMSATFYVNSARVGQSDFMTWAQLEALDADGHEIAGHTLDHLDLTQLSDADARTQVCDDRASILARGFVVRSFAYPFGEYGTREQAIVRDCGYASGRAAFGLRNITATNDSRPYSGPIPPPDPYGVLTPCCIRSNVTLSDLQNYITQAELAGGGWVPLVLHRVCDGCGDSPAPSISPATLEGLLDWLQQRAAQGTVVRTVSQVISGDATPPSSSISCNGSPCSSSSYSSPVSVTLAATDGSSGVAGIRYTTDGSEPKVSSTVYNGAFSVSATTTVKFRAWDNAGNVEPTRTQLIQVSSQPADTQPPTTTITCNGSACSGWYRAAVTVALAATDDSSGVDAIHYTLDGSDPTVSSTLYTGPFSVSITTTVKFRAWDNAGNVEPTRSQLIQIDRVAPTVVITSPTDGSRVKGNVKVNANAADDLSGVVSVNFYVNGVLVGTKTSAPYFVNWQTNKLPKGQYTLTAVAVDAAGNSASSTPVVVTV